MKSLLRILDRFLTPYASADWLTFQRARALLVLNLLIMAGALLDGIVSSEFLGEIVVLGFRIPSVLSDAILFFGLLASLVLLARGRFVSAVSVTIVVAAAGITVARVMSTGFLAVDPAYDIIQYAFDLVVLLYLVLLFSGRLRQVVVAAVAGVLILLAYTLSLPPVFGMTLPSASFSVLVGGLVLVCVAGVLAISTFLLNSKAIEVAHRASMEQVESERKARAVLDSSSHFVGLLSTDGTLLDANNSALRFASVQLKDVIGRKFWDTVWWEHSPELQELLRTQLEIAARGDVVRFEATHRSAEGSLRVIDFSLSPIKDAEGRVVSVIPEGRDITEIVETQRALVESRLKYFTLFNAASDAIFILRSGVFIDCNASTLTLFGVTRDQIIGKSPWEFSPRFQLDGRFSEEKAREYIEASLEGETQTFEWLHARYDGATFIAEVRLTRLDLEDDNRSLFAIVRDITARRHAEDALKESEERYRDLVEHLPIGVVVATDEHIVYVNSAAVHLLGLPSRDQGVGRSVYDFVPRENWEATRDRRSRVIRTAGRSDSAEAKIVRLDRTLVDIASVVTQIKYNGKPSILNLLTDITERKQADEALRQSEEKFSKAFQTSPAPMSILTLRDLRFVDVSRAFLEKMGYSRDEVIGRSLEELGLFEKEAEREAIAKILAEEGEVRDFESAFRMKGGEVRHGITSATVFLLKGEPCVLSVVVDVTERRRAELALRHSMQQLHDLAERLELIREEERKAISREVHDELGQLLTALKLDLFALKKGGLIADSAEAIANVDSMLTLIGSAITAVQDISRKLRPGILDNLGLVAAVQWQAEEFQKRSAIECRLSLPKGELVLDDRRSTTLFRILQEALTNVARHAQARKVDITLSATPEEGILVVADDGIGIDDQIINDPKSIGLLGIRERLHPLGGVCIIRRRATGGTEVLVRLPLKDIIIHRAP